MSIFKKKNDDIEEPKPVEIKIYPQPVNTTKTDQQVKQNTPAVTSTYKQPQSAYIPPAHDYGYPDAFEIDLFSSGPKLDHEPFSRSMQDSYSHVTGRPLKEDAFGQPWNQPKSVPKPVSKIVYEKTGAIIFVVENTINTITYREEIMRLVNKIIEDNTTSMFMFMKLASESNFSKLLCYDEINTTGFPNTLLSENDVITTTCNLDDVLISINKFVKDTAGFKSLVDIGEKRYILSDMRIIFIGTGEQLSCTDVSSNILHTLCSNKNVKTIKFFCMKDVNAIHIAAMGFPVIGHIESNFYK